jgi:hypothetical protein
MFSITRKQFLDWRVGPGDLDDMTDVWLGWHKVARTRDGRDLQGYHAVEARLECVPRQERDALLARLRHTARAIGEADVTISSSQPDSVTLATSFVDFSKPCSLGAWLEAFVDPAFLGMVLMLRLSVYDWLGEAEGPAAAGDTLVLVGTIEEGSLLLKAIWPAGLEPGPERLYEKAAWLGEASFVRAVKDLRRTGLAPSDEDRFAPRRAQRRRSFLLRLYFRLPDQDRLGSFLARAGFHFAGLLAVVILYLLLPFFPFKLSLAYSFGALFLTGLAFVVGRQAKQVAAYHRNMVAALKRVYAQSVRFYEVNSAELGLLDDPNSRKYACDLENLGLRHLADVHHEPKATARTYTRIFAVPGEPTYVLLNLMFATRTVVMFPAKAFYLINTYLDDDRRVATGNEGGGFRKRLVKNVTVRFFPVIDHPGDLLARHREVVDRKLAEGCRLAPVMEVSALLKRMENDHEQMRALMKRHGYYSWSAAFRQCFRLVRREYRE